MNNRLQQKNSSENGLPYRVWKVNPPGDAQIELNRLFEVKEISPTATADYVQKKYPIFQKYSAKVFSSHFRTTRAKLGFNARNIVEDCDNEMQIPELGHDNKTSSSSSIGIPDDVFCTDEAISHSNSPYFAWVYTDHEKKCDFVVVLMPIFAGSREVKFTLSDDGMYVNITYFWPVALYAPEIVFENLPSTHPMVHSFISNMLDKGITQKSNPNGSIKIALPCRVQREVGAFEMSVVEHKSTRMIKIIFKAYQKSEDNKRC